MKENGIIGGIDYCSAMMLAPLAGVTDIGMRRLCRKFGADLTTTEMISAKGLVMRSAGTDELLLTDELETPVAVQLFGHDPFVMKDAAGDPRLGKFAVIDINMGCPVKKVTKTGGGAALSKTLDRAATMVSVMKSAAAQPITVKFRLGWDDRSKNYLAFGKLMEEAGAAAVTLHARTAVQGYEGVADWNAIGELNAALRIPVVANGDIVDRNAYERVRQITGCGGVMIGRGSMGRPWIFDQLKGKAEPPNLLEVIREHMTVLTRHHGEHFAVINMRHHLSWYFKGIPGAAKLRGELYSCTTLAQMEALIQKITENR